MTIAIPCTNAYDRQLLHLQKCARYGYSADHQPGVGQRKSELLQGSFAVEELTNLVEAAVLAEFDRINEEVVCWVLWSVIPAQ